MGVIANLAICQTLPSQAERVNPCKPLTPLNLPPLSLLSESKPGLLLKLYWQPDMPITTGCWPPPLPLSAATAGRNHLNEYIKYPPTPHWYRRTILPNPLPKPYHLNVKQRSCADVNSLYQRKCWTNSVFHLHESLGILSQQLFSFIVPSFPIHCTLLGAGNAHATQELIREGHAVLLSLALAPSSLHIGKISTCNTERKKTKRE